MILRYALLNGCWEYKESLFNSFSFINVLEELGYQLKLVKENENPDVVFISCFGKITYKGHALKVGYISEDMNRFQEIYHKMTEGYFDLFIGCIPPSKSKKFCKHPYYINITNYKEHTKEYIEKINNMVKDFSKDFSKLKFCTLVASHDMHGNRMPILKMMEKISKVECPGKLNNNTPSFDDEGLSKIDYISQFIFNICPENNKGHEGYTTEKIRECINAGCIPIYYGNCNDNIDIKIFNQNRIIRYDPNDKKSIEDCYNKVKQLYENKEKLKEFYQQSPYVEGAETIFREMFEEYKKKFSKALKKNNNKKNIRKVLICFFGVINRSIKYTINNLKKNLIEPIKKNYDTEIYIFNNNIEDAIIDGTTIENKNYELLNYNFFEEELQKDIDIKIKDYIIKNNITVRFRNDYDDKITQNAMRQLYSENKVGEFIEKNKKKYDACIICGPDYYIANKINIDDIKNSINNNFIATTLVNPAQGYTNGFYIGSPKNLICILKRYSKLNLYLPTNKDYENLLKRSFENNLIKNEFIKLVFFKIRANKKVCWQGNKNTFFLDDDDKKKVINEYNDLKNNGFILI